MTGPIHLHDSAGEFLPDAEVRRFPGHVLAHFDQTSDATGDSALVVAGLGCLVGIDTPRKIENNGDRRSDFGDDFDTRHGISFLKESRRAHPIHSVMRSMILSLVGRKACSSLGTATTLYILRPRSSSMPARLVIEAMAYLWDYLDQYLALRFNIFAISSDIL